MIQKLIEEFASVFSDAFLHVGGDEMQLACWDAVPHIQSFMKENKLANSTELQAYFEAKLLAMVSHVNRYGTNPPAFY